MQKTGIIIERSIVRETMRKKKGKLCAVLLLSMLITSAFPVYADELNSESGIIEITSENNPSRYSAYQVFEYTGDGNIKYNRIQCRYTADCLKQWFVGPDAQRLMEDHKKDYGGKLYLPCRGCRNHFYTNEEWDSHCITAMKLNGPWNPCVNQSYDIVYNDRPDSVHANSEPEKQEAAATVAAGSYYIFKDSEWYPRVKSYLDTYKDTCGFTWNSYNDGDFYVIDNSSATDSQKENFYKYLYDYIPVEAVKHSQVKTSSSVRIENLDSGMYLVIGEYDEKNPIKDYIGAVWLNTGNTAEANIAGTAEEGHQAGGSGPVTPDKSLLEEWMPPVSMTAVCDANVIDENGNVIGFIMKGSDIGVSGQCTGYYQVNYGARRSFLPKEVLVNH